jgi:acid phosphatase (class A)
MGASAIARLHADPVFRAELKDAKKELVSARTEGVQPSRDCKVESNALK